MIESVHQFEILKPTDTQGAMGDLIRTYTKQDLPVGGRAIVVSEKEKVEYGVRSERAVWKLLTDSNPNLSVGDRVQFDYGDGDVRTLRVLRSSYPRSANIAFFKTICDEDETTI